MGYNYPDTSKVIISRVSRLAMTVVIAPEELLCRAAIKIHVRTFVCVSFLCLSDTFVTDPIIGIIRSDDRSNYFFET